MSTAEWKKQLPMYATYSRILVTPVLVAVLFTRSPYTGWIAAIIFALGSITDFFDGYWARKFNAESAMGKFMDPIADKIFILGSLVMLLYMQKVDPIMVMLLLGRDIFIGGIRSVAATNQVIIAAKPFGKWKTAFQMGSIPCIFIERIELWNLDLATIGYYGMWISVALSLVSGVEYTLGYYKGRRTS